jgi:hypothetical protein
MHTMTLTPADTIALTPAAGGIATAVRRLAGSAFRPHSWPCDPRGSLTAAAAFVARVGFPADHDSAGRCTIGTHPRGSAADGYTPSLPSRLIIVAVAVADAEGASPQPYLDRSFDLLAGLCLCAGARRATLLGDISMHGFGFTMNRIRNATERTMLALFAIDARNVGVRAGFVTRPQRSLHDGAMRVLAAQYAAEAADATLPPLDRARRVAAALRIDARAGEKFLGAFGADETGEALALYAEVAATDDGSEAWARFARGVDRANPAEPSDESSGETMRRADEAADAQRSAAETAARTDREDGSSPDADAFAEESGAEGKERRARAKTMKAAPKGRSKADQAASESAEAAAVTNGAAAAAEVATRTEGGVDTAASRQRNRAPNGVIIAD